MDFKHEDDFWNATSGHSFAFDDEDTEAQLQEDNEDFNSKLAAFTTLPIQTIISAENLKLVLQDVIIPVTLPVTTRMASIDETISKLCLGLNCSLENVKSQEDKLYLLDKSVETYDGNVILKIVLFMLETLKKNIVFRHLATRPMALQQYCNYLSSMSKLDELHLLYMATGNIKNLSNLFYLSCQNTSTSNIHKKLNQFNIEHLDSLDDDFEKSLFQAHKQFLDYKLEHNLPDYSSSPSSTFAYLCKTKLDKLSIDDSELQSFLKLTKISPFKSEWIMLNTLAAHERWHMLNNVFEAQKWFNINIKNVGLGKPNQKKYHVSMEAIVTGLHKHGAPRGILEDFLKRMDDSDKALYLGMKYECHSFVVDTLVARKDRVGLREYKSAIINHTDWVRVIDKALLSDKKWIN